jgi:hypothetical protein
MAQTTGRRSLMTPEVLDRMKKYIIAGNKPLSAARACGVKDPTFWNWERLGREEIVRMNSATSPGESKILTGKKKYVEFVDNLDLWVSESIAYAVVDLRMLAKKDFKALKFWLEHTAPDEWGDNKANDDSKGAIFKALDDFIASSINSDL